MPLTLELNPSRTINSIKSRTAANRSQLGYQFQRKDHVSSGVLDNGGFAQIIVTGEGDIRDQFPVGTSVIYVSNSGVTIGGAVTSADLSETNTALTLDQAYTTNPGSGWLNNLTARPFYRVEIQLKAEDGEIFADNIAYEPDPTGEVFVDVQGFLRPRTFFDRNENYSLSYRENWLGNTPGGYVGDEFIQAISANLTLYGRPGANMWDYLLKAQGPYSSSGILDDGGFEQWVLGGAGDIRNQFTIGDTVEFRAGTDIRTGKITSLQLSGPDAALTVDRAFVNNPGSGTVTKISPSGTGRFLTAFASEAGRYWEGWKNNVYYLVDLDYLTRLTGLTALRNFVVYRGPNGENLGSDNLNTGTPSAQIRLFNDSFFNIPANTFFLEYSVRDQTSTIIYTDSHRRTYKKDECVNPVMVEYRNEKGGFDQWLFQFNQTLVESLETSLSWERRIERPWEEIQRTYERGTLERRQTIRVVAENISKQEYYGLAELFTSNEVYVWLNKDGSRKIGAVVRGNPPRVIRTKTRRQNLQVTLAFPNDFNFFQAVEYDLNQGLI